MTLLETPLPNRQWTRVCDYCRLLPERGVAVLLDDGEQAALFRTYDGAVYAISNHDPLSGAYVISRGIVGTRGNAPVVVSPMHKQAFDLRTGVCLDDPELRIAVYDVRVHDGGVEVAT